MDEHRFRLAPMSPLIRGLTIILLLLPIPFGIGALIWHNQVANLTFLLLIAVYGSVWLWCRPSHFVVFHDCLEIVFPGWRRRISLQDIRRIRMINKETFHQEFGWAMRIGVGGLWGGFGWLWTSKQGLLEFYISRTDDLVLIERSIGNSLLLTPEHPNQFVEVIQDILS
jgi:hypothetical protein